MGGEGCLMPKHPHPRPFSPQKKKTSRGDEKPISHPERLTTEMQDGECFESVRSDVAASAWTRAAAEIRCGTGRGGAAIPGRKGFARLFAAARGR